MQLLEIGGFSILLRYRVSPFIREVPCSFIKYFPIILISIEPYSPPLARVFFYNSVSAICKTLKLPLARILISDERPK